MNGSFNNTNLTSNNHLTSNHVDEQGTAVVLSIVMPIVLVLFCVAYTIWSVKRDTRSDKTSPRQMKRLRSKKTLRINPVRIGREETRYWD